MTNEEQIKLRALILRHSNKEAGLIDRGVRWISGKASKAFKTKGWQKAEEASPLAWKELAKAKKLNPEGAKALEEVHNIPGVIEKHQTISDLAQINEKNWQAAAKLPKKFTQKYEYTTKGGKVKKGTREVGWDSQAKVDAEGTTVQQAMANQDITTKKSKNRMRKIKNFGYTALGTATLGAPVAGAYYVGSNLLTPQPSTGGFVNQDPYSQTNY